MLGGGVPARKTVAHDVRPEVLLVPDGRTEAAGPS